jgi:DNA polymerase III gamma/tau subunit
MNIKFNQNIQTHLFIGPAIDLNNNAINILKEIFCINNKCNSCIICTQISKKSYEQVLWLKPEKQYNLEQIDTIIKNISFTLEKEKKYFIVFEQAELLTIACSNRLLKSIEEPPAGYYFIFLTERPQLILPTILSRCVVSSFDVLNNNFSSLINELESSEIGKYFIHSNSDPVDFLKTIEKLSISEYASLELVDKLINYWSGKFKNAIINNKDTEYQKIQNTISILHKAFQTPPMPGSNKIFWKNLYINFID